jgi:hypothetical protein
MGLNRKTNIWGVLAALFSVGKLVVDAHNGQPLDFTTVLAAATGVSAGLGLTQAKDNNVTGTGITAVKVHSDGTTESPKL